MGFDYKQALLDTLKKRYPDPDRYPYRSWTYPQAFMLWGFIKEYEKTKNQDYRQYILNYCSRHVDERGVIDRFTGNSLDDIMPGSVLVWAYTETGQERYRTACHTIRKVYDTYPRTTMGGFWHAKDLEGEMWVDGVFMNLMFLIRYGRYIGDTDDCYDEAVKQLDIIYRCCNKDQSGLLYHGYSENPRVSWAHPVTGKAPEVWSEGLGWYALILAEVLDVLPQEYPGRGRILKLLKKLAADLIKVQDKKAGLWYQVVDKPKWRRNWHDSSGSAMFLYCLGKGIDRGWLPESEYKECVKRGYQGLKTKLWLDPDGCLNVNDACNGLCVQNDYDGYVDYVRAVNAQEAVAACLWALIQQPDF